MFVPFGTASAARFERCGPAGDGVGLVGCGCGRGSIDVVETKAQFAFSLGIPSQKVDSIVPTSVGCLINTEFANRRIVERARAGSLTPIMWSAAGTTRHRCRSLCQMCASGWRCLAAGCQPLFRSPNARALSAKWWRKTRVSASSSRRRRLMRCWGRFPLPTQRVFVSASSGTRLLGPSLWSRAPRRSPGVRWRG